jgi:ABC-type uncharacterized transport system substrate-binding protein
MRRRQLLSGLAVGSLSALVACGRLSLEQPTPKVPVVGMLLPGKEAAPGDPNNALTDAFLQGMHELGWIDDQNVHFIKHSGGYTDEGMRAAMTDLLNQHVDVIWTDGTGIRIASDATATIPIVMLTTADLSQAVPLARYSRSGGNVTGVASFPELQVKRLQFLKEAVPSISRVALLWTSINTGEFKAATSAADELRVQLLPLQIESPDDFPKAFQAALEWHADSLLTSSGNVFSQNLQDIVGFATAQQLPAMYYRTEYVDAGGLMAYGINYYSFFKRSALYVDKILRGARAADLPIEQPTDFELAINLKTAQAQGISMPQDLLLQATKLVQ